MHSRSLVATLLAVALITMPAAALAASETQVSIPWGDWLASILTFANEIVVPLVGVVVAWALKQLPPAVAGYLKTLQVEQLLDRAIGWGLTAVRGAAEGKQLTFDIGNKVAAQAVQYAVDHAPTLVAWMGGPAKLKEKILARLDVTEGTVVRTAADGTKELGV